MCCWLIVAWAFAPRLALFLMAIFNNWITRAFGNVWMPLLGFFILPWTTLVYVLVAPGGLGFLDIVFLVVAVLADLSAWGGGATQRAKRSHG